MERSARDARFSFSERAEVVAHLNLSRHLAFGSWV